MNKNEEAIGVSWQDVFRVVVFVIAVCLAVHSVSYTKACYYGLGLNELMGASEEHFKVNPKELVGIQHGLIVFPLWVNQLTMSLAVICLAAVLKRGFVNLKPTSKTGFMFMLILFWGVSLFVLLLCCPGVFCAPKNGELAYPLACGVVSICFLAGVVLGIVAEKYDC